MPTIPQIALMALFAGLLLYAAWGDIRARIIPNWLNAAIALAAPLWWLAIGVPPWPGMAILVAGSAIVFAIFATTFALGLMGGGDVKLLTAVALWFAPLPLMRMIVAMALIGGVLTLFMVVLHRARRAPGQPEIPYGVAISAAALWVMTNGILTNPAA